jgi:hypothetical protein
VKPAGPRKNRPKPRQEKPDPPNPPARTRRPLCPADVLSHEANVEFLRSIADICNARADEVEQAETREGDR